MEGIIQSVKPEGDFKDSNVYVITLDNGTTAQAYIQKGSYNDSRFADGTHIGQKMSYELTAKGNFSKIFIGEKKEGQSYGGSKPSYNGSSSYKSNGTDNRQVSIVRQSMLKASVDFLSGKPNVTKEHVLALAESFEAWVNRVEATEAKNDHFTRAQPTTNEQPPIEVVASDVDSLPF